MKIRSIRPEFFADPTMAQLDPMARLLYIGLWCYVDDDGRGEWLPKLIEGSIFPLEDVDIHALLEQCVRSARIVRYTDGDREFFHIPTFTEYQKPNRKFDSKLPDPAECRQVSPRSASAARTHNGRSTDAPPVEGEGEGEGEGVETSSRALAVVDSDARDTNRLTAIKEELVDLFGEPRDWSQYQRAACWFYDHGGSRTEVRRRAGALTAEWGTKAATVAALEKHWTRYDAEISRVTDDQVVDHQRTQRRAAELERAQANDRARRNA